MNTSAALVPLTDDKALLDHFGPMLGTASRRQLWIFCLDDEDRPGGIAMPVDDYPADPRALVGAGGVEPLSVAELFGIRFAEIAHEANVAQFVLVWERRGGAELTGATRDWARMLGDALHRHGARVRAQLLLHDAGLRVLAPDDLV